MMRSWPRPLARLTALLAVQASLSGPAWGQQAEGTPAPAPPEGYSYSPAGRRDPFISLLSRGIDARSVSKASGGLQGLAVADLTVKGIVMSRDGYVAMIQAPDTRTYIVRANDQLLDGRVKAVTPGEVIVTQEINDPLSLIKQRDVRKPLRPMDQAQ